MDVTGERRIPASRERVWAALNDPAVLQSCIPGCESLVREADDTLVGTALVKIGPINARFSGRMQFSELDPPHSYRVTGEGQGGVAGFANGGAAVRLRDEPPFTVMDYVLQAQVGGKIAQLGARLIEATVTSGADQFFDRFVTEVAGSPDTELAAAGPAGVIAAVTNRVEGAAQHPPAVGSSAMSLLARIPREPYGLPLVAWMGMALFALVFVMIFIV